MTPEIWAPIGTTLAVGAGIAVFGWRMINSLDTKLSARIDRLGTRIDDLQKDMAFIGSRLSRIEGWIQGRFREGTASE